MTRVALSAALLFGLAVADWASIGPSAGPVYAGAISASNPQTVYVAAMGSPSRVLKSTDAGMSWGFTPAGLSDCPTDMAVDPTDARMVYTVGGTMFRTTNGGETWSQLPGPANCYCRTVATNPQNPQEVYVGGYSYGTTNRVVVARTADRGANWSVLFCDTTSMRMGYSVCLDPVDTTIIYAGGVTVGTGRTLIYRSTDHGGTWARSDLGVASTPCALHVSSLDHNLVTAATAGGLYRSTDGGTTWARTGSFTNVNRLAEVPAEPSIMYAATSSSVYRSTDTGRTWTQTGSGVVGTGTFCLLTTPQSNSTVLCGTKAGVYRSSDYGANWQPVMNGVVFNRAAAIGLGGPDDRALYVECRDNAVFRTTDDGQTWLRSPEFLSCGNICGVTVSPADPNVVWALEGSG